MLRNHKWHYRMFKSLGYLTETISLCLKSYTKSEKGEYFSGQFIDYIFRVDAKSRLNLKLSQNIANALRDIPIAAIELEDISSYTSITSLIEHLKNELKKMIAICPALIIIITNTPLDYSIREKILASLEKENILQATYSDRIKFITITRSDIEQFSREISNITSQTRSFRVLINLVKVLGCVLNNKAIRKLLINREVGLIDDADVRALVSFSHLFNLQIRIEKRGLISRVVLGESGEHVNNLLFLSKALACKESYGNKLSTYISRLINCIKTYADTPYVIKTEYKLSELRKEFLLREEEILDFIESGIVQLENKDGEIYLKIITPLVVELKNVISNIQNL